MAIYGLNHTWAADLDIMLQYDDGLTNRYLQVMSDLRGSDDLNSATLIFDDSATGILGELTEGAPIESGTYRPFGGSTTETFANYIIGGSTAEVPNATADGTVSFASQFAGLDVNADWSLYVVDDSQFDTGSFDAWSLTVETTDIRGSISAIQVASLVVSFNSTSATSGSYTISDGSYVEYDGVEGWTVSGSTFNTSMTVFGSAGNDYLAAYLAAGPVHFMGGDGHDTLDGGVNRDTLYGGAGDDEFRIYRNTSAWDLAPGEIYDGGTGQDALTIQFVAPGTESIDFRNVTVRSIEELSLDMYLATPPGSTEYRVRFNDVQIGAGLSSNAALTFFQQDHVTIQMLSVHMTLQDSLNLSGLTFAPSFGAEDRVEIFGDSSDEVLTGAVVRTLIMGEAGNDVLVGLAGNDWFFGGTGNDILIGGGGGDQLNGGAGTRDRVQYTDSTVGLRIDLGFSATNTGIAAGDIYVEIEDVYGSAYSDTIFGDGMGNILWADAGNDSLEGLLGNDTIYGGAGNDVLIGGAGADILDGGAGTRDRVQYTDSTVGLRVDIQVTTFNTGIAVGDVFVGVEDIYGSFHGDTLLGDTANNIIWGDNGNDAWLDGRIGNDTVYGGGGNDVLIGGFGADVLDGGAGTRDRVQYTDSSAGLRVDIQVTTFNTGIAVGDSFIGVEDIYGSFHGDTLLGDAGGNILWGAGGNDVIDGRDGADTLIGGAGNDTLTGGAGADVFLFETALGATNVDSISGYTVADDVIHLENAIFTALTATGTLAGTAFVTGAAATTAAHRIIYNSANGQLLYDADGTGAGAAIHFATLATGLAMTAGEFLVM